METNTKCIKTIAFALPNKKDKRTFGNRTRVSGFRVSCANHNTMRIDTVSKTEQIMGFNTHAKLRLPKGRDKTPTFFFLANSSLEKQL